MFSKFATPFHGLLVAVGAFALLVSACGGNDNEPISGDDDAPSASAPAATDAGDDDSEPTPAGSTDDGDNGGGTIDPLDVCGLFTANEIASALGADEMSDGSQSSPIYASFSGCQWESVDPMQPYLAVIDVSVGDTAYHETTYENWKLYNDPQPVDGVGDMAQWDSLTNQIDVIEGDRYVIVQVLTGAAEEQAAIDVASQLAEMTLERVP